MNKIRCLMWFCMAVMFLGINMLQSHALFDFKPQKADLYSDDFDIKADSLEAVYRMREYEIMTGVDGAFLPEKTLNRAEAATIILRAKDIVVNPKNNTHTFSDVPMDAWYHDAIHEMVKRGWMKGYPDGTIRPEQKLNNAEWAMLLYRAFEMQETLDFWKQTGNSKAFNDVPEDAWFSPAVTALEAFMFTPGFGGNYKPEALVERQKAAWFIHKIISDQYFQDLSYDRKAYVEAQKNGREYISPRINSDGSIKTKSEGYDPVSQRVVAILLPPKEEKILPEVGAWSNFGSICFVNGYDTSIKIIALKKSIHLKSENNNNSEDVFQIKLTSVSGKEDVLFETGLKSTQDLWLKTPIELGAYKKECGEILLYVNPEMKKIDTYKAKFTFRLMNGLILREGNHGFTRAGIFSNAGEFIGKKNLVLDIDIQ